MATFLPNWIFNSQRRIRNLGWKKNAILKRSNWKFKRPQKKQQQKRTLSKELVKIKLCSLYLKYKQQICCVYNIVLCVWVFISKRFLFDSIFYFIVMRLQLNFFFTKFFSLLNLTLPTPCPRFITNVFLLDLIMRLR